MPKSQIEAVQRLSAVHRQKPLLTGQRFTRLLVLGLYATVRGHREWACLCDCGKIKTARGSHLAAGSVKSCGCLRHDTRSALTHGQSKTQEYRIFKGAKNRCQNAKCPHFKNYGGRGIEFRFTSFEQFLDCVGKRPSPQHSLDRYPDNDGHYEPGNVRWATNVEQANNTRRNVGITLNGRTQSAAQWSRELGLGRQTILYRIKCGWTDADALTCPVRKGNPATECREAHPRIWRHATKDQRREILAKYQETGSIRKAFAAIKAYRVTDADMQWFGVRLGGGR